MCSGWRGWLGWISRGRGLGRRYASFGSATDRPGLRTAERPAGIGVPALQEAALPPAQVADLRHQRPGGYRRPRPQLTAWQEVPKSASGGPGWRPASGGPSHKLLPNGKRPAGKGVPALQQDADLREDGGGRAGWWVWWWAGPVEVPPLRSGRHNAGRTRWAARPAGMRSAEPGGTAGFFAALRMTGGRGAETPPYSRGRRHAPALRVGVGGFGGGELAGLGFDGLHLGEVGP